LDVEEWSRGRIERVICMDPREYITQVNVRVTRVEHSRRFLSLNYAIEYVTTHLQEIPQRIR